MTIFLKVISSLPNGKKCKYIILAIKISLIIMTMIDIYLEIQRDYSRR